MEKVVADLYAHRDEAAGDETPALHAGEIRSVVSVRFNRGELERIAAAAVTAGQPLSTYIRNAALAAAGAVDIEAARRELRTATHALDELGRSLGTVA
jgi:uncharacterized protein (DUF1778 family)